MGRGEAFASFSCIGIGIWVVLRHVYRIILEIKSKARLWWAITEDFGQHTLWQIARKVCWRRCAGKVSCLR